MSNRDLPKPKHLNSGHTPVEFQSIDDIGHSIVVVGQPLAHAKLGLGLRLQLGRLLQSFLRLFAQFTFFIFSYITSLKIV